MSSAPASRPGRLSVDVWVQAALELLAAKGIAAVKVNELCRRLGVTKGSFYWHFDDLDALHDAMADRWGAGTDRARAELGSLDDAPAEERLRVATRRFLAEQLGPLDRAMREWARTDDRARRAVAASDRHVFAFLVAAFRDLGFDAAQADLRAKALYYAGVGFGHVGLLGRRGQSPADLLQLLTSGAR